MRAHDIYRAFAYGSGGFQTETGWATGNALNGGSWATYFTFTLTCNCGVDPEDPVKTRCETAFAVAEANRNFVSISRLHIVS
ncbi:MAG: hypothetical protein IT292_02965 [Deltaproteobacteria bacterium]|nr:hypothetical protein [Deltaproteobacteria bacterium]